MKDIIQPKDFFSKYVIKNIPLVVRNVVDENQAIRVTWTDERLTKMYDWFLVLWFMSLFHFAGMANPKYG